MVINTRPVGRAAALSKHLQAAGMTVAEIPMLTLQPRPTTDDDLIMMRQWLLGEYKALIIVSPTAAASGLAVWRSLVCAPKEHSQQHHANISAADTMLKAPSPLIAVGEATAAVFNRVRQEMVRCQVRLPKTANNEGMLAMPEIHHLQAGDKVLIWRGLGGRRLLVDVLQARGIQVDSIAWYERIMPYEATAQYQQWRHAFLTPHTHPISAAFGQSKPIVVISSGTAFEHWSTVVHQTATNTDLSGRVLTLSDFVYIVLGERLANQVAKQQLSYWQVDDLAPDTILTAINAIT